MSNPAEPHAAPAGPAPDSAQGKRGVPRICLCVLMNHPFPANLPLLRRLYAGRFSAVRFLIPFERSADPDVITVYRGSYVHAAYVADARAELAALDCDYYLVVHDDVLVTPRLNEATFLDLFPLAPDEAFIPVVTGAPHDMGSWVWHYGMIARLLFPKSMLFGSGVEPANIVGYLPDADRLTAAMHACDVWPALSVRLDPDAMAGIATGEVASRLLLHGFAERLAADDAQAGIDSRSLALERDLVATMRDALRARPRDPLAADAMEVPLPIPLASAGYSTDFYILPRSGLADYCHYIGVASAANLFVEIIAPTLLFACSSRVQTARTLGLDFSGFDRVRRPDWFLRDRAAAIHPFKLSAIKAGDQQDAFVAMMAAIGEGRLPEEAVAVRAGFGTSLDSILRDGWGRVDPWGSWSEAHDATLELTLHAPTTVRLHLAAPIHPLFPTVNGRITYNDGADVLDLTPTWPDNDFTVDLSLRPDAEGIARIVIHAERFVVPADWGPEFNDRRALGIGIRRAEWDGRSATGDPPAAATGR